MKLKSERFNVTSNHSRGHRHIAQGQGQSLSSMMDMLSIQQSSSFRHPAVAPVIPAAIKKRRLRDRLRLPTLVLTMGRQERRNARRSNCKSTK